MAYYCIDYINGSDVTGDGTASAPWASIAHGETQINGGAGYVTGDEMRIASSPISAALGQVTGVASAQSNAVRLNVNTDLTGVLSVYDAVWIDGTTSATSAGGNNMLWQVEAITATTIDLWNGSTNYQGRQMFGDSGSFSLDIKKVTSVEVAVNGFSGYQADTLNSVDTAFTSFNDDVVISGGWNSTNFTAKAAYPFTSFSRVGTYQTTSGSVYGAGFSWANNSNGFKLKDFNAARMSLTQDLNYSDCTFCHNLENIPIIYHTNTGTSTPSPAPVGAREYINCQVAAKINTTFATGDADLYYAKFTDCYHWAQSQNTLIAGTTGFGSSKQQVELLGNNIHVKGGHVSQYNISGVVSNGTSANTANQPFRSKPLVSDFSKLTVIPKSSLGIGLVDYQSSPRFAHTISVPSGLMNKNGSDGVKHLMYGTSPSASAYTFDFANITDALNLDQPIAIGKNNVGGNPIKVTGGGNTYDLLGTKLFARLNTVDHNLGDNCIELIPTNQADTPTLEGPFMPIRFAKGDNITVTIIGKVKGTATSFSPAIRLAGTDAQGPETRYDGFEGLENFGISSGSGYNNTTWSTNVYSITNAFSNETNANYVGQLALYSDQLDQGDSWLIDSITIEIT